MGRRVFGTGSEVIRVGDSAAIAKSKHTLHPTLLLVKPPLPPPLLHLAHTVLCWLFPWFLELAAQTEAQWLLE